MKKNKIESIQALRAIAALLVCSMHTATQKSTTEVFFIYVQKILSIIGSYGVDLFFAISGFIMSWIVLHENLSPSIREGLAFFVKRIFRIYPLFWFTLAVMTVLSVLFNGQITLEVKQALHGSVLFLLTPHIPLQYAAWSLPFELYFYVVMLVFICFFSQKNFMIFFCSWISFHLMLVVMSSYGIIAFQNFIFVNVVLLEFFIGIVVGYLFYKYPCASITKKYISILCGCVILISGFIYASLSFTPTTKWMFCLTRVLPAGLILYGVIGLELHDKLKVPRWLIKLGDISYSIYLWNFPVLAFASYIFNHSVFYQETAAINRFMIEMIAIILLSFISYRWIEQPCVRFSHRIVNKIK